MPLLEFVSHRIQGGRLLIVGTFRDVQVSRTHPLNDTLGELVRAEGFQLTRLNDFSDDEVKQSLTVVTGYLPSLRRLADRAYPHAEVIRANRGI
ncbi:MAG: hypothetical protein CL879_03580 [Dehalococcoidia bacterium]|nr:hypothetical protein [Dehalococcoidia bacterium]